MTYALGFKRTNRATRGTLRGVEHVPRLFDALERRGSPKLAGDPPHIGQVAIFCHICLLPLRTVVNECPFSVIRERITSIVPCRDYYGSPNRRRPGADKKSCRRFRGEFLKTDLLVTQLSLTVYLELRCGLLTS